MSTFVITTLYKFTSLPDFASLKAPLLELMLENSICGTLLLAHEGLNGTIAGTHEATNNILAWLSKHPSLGTIEYKQSYSQKKPFNRTKVKLKKEIVTMGIDSVNPLKAVGNYVKPSEWNELISSPDVTVIDTRNTYETEIGTFKNAITPNTNSFREFPNYVKNNLNPQKNKKVAMFCTGGIRCEKSTAYLKDLGFDEVYHLKGGILKYLEEVPEGESLWEGECFVFDERVAVNHSLEPGKYEQCHACRHPITPEDKASSHYKPGVSCPRCFDNLTSLQIARFEEREKQNQLAKARGEVHIGSVLLKKEIVD